MRAAVHIAGPMSSECSGHTAMQKPVHAPQGTLLSPHNLALVHTGRILLHLCTTQHTHSTAQMLESGPSVAR